jgi:hypothetical protein
VNQVCCTSAIRCAKSRGNHAGTHEVHCCVRPVAFTAGRALHCPHFSDLRVCSAEQIVYVPVQAFFYAEMVGQPPP